MDCAELHETKIHGSIAFPYSVYRGRIPEWIHSFPLHWHESFELIYCETGSIQAALWGQAYTLRAGDLLVVLPPRRSLHRACRTGGGGNTTISSSTRPSSRVPGETPAMTNTSSPS